MGVIWFLTVVIATGGGLSYLYYVYVRPEQVVARNHSSELKLIRVNANSKLSPARAIPDVNLWWDLSHEKFPVEILSQGFPRNVITLTEALNAVGDHNGLTTQDVLRLWSSNDKVTINPLLGEVVDLDKLDYKVSTAVYGISRMSIRGVSGGELPNASEALPLVVKYSSYCKSDDEPINPMLNEILFLSYLNAKIESASITHKIAYFSDPAYLVVPDSFNERRRSGGKVSSSCHCDDGSYPEIRYMVTERLGPDVWQMMLMEGGQNGRVSLKRASEYAMYMIALLKDLHLIESIVHGDIHITNFAYSADWKRLVLFDWEKARLINNVGGRLYVDMLANRRGNDVWCNWGVSEWEAAYYDKPSFRDDFYRLVLVVANLIYGDDVANSFNRMCEQSENSKDFAKKHLEFKRSMNIFEFRLSLEASTDEMGNFVPATTKHFSLANVLSSSTNLPMNLRLIQSVRKLLTEVVALAREPKSPLQKPNYDKAIECFEQIYLLLA